MDKSELYYVHYSEKKHFNRISKNLHSQKDDPVTEEKTKLKSYKLNS